MQRLLGEQNLLDSSMASPLEGTTELFEGLVESAPDAMVIVDQAGTIVLVNGQAERIFGYARAELIGQKIELLVPSRFQKQHPGHRDRYMADPRTRPMGAGLELFARRKDGSEFPVEISLATLKTKQGALVSSVIRDLTDRKKLEAVQAEAQQLKTMSDFRARFLNVAAHELKTPMTPIRLQVALLRLHLGQAPEAVTRSLGILERSVERLNQLMEDVLDAARIQAAQLRVRKEPVALSALVHEAVENYETVAKEVGVQLSGDIEENLFILGDPSRVLQVLNNLLSNTLKFTPPQGQVFVHLDRHDAKAVLVVQDSGRGMTPEQIGQLFQPFTQVHPELDATRKGTGLGLYITKAIIEQHDGTIDMTSAGPEQGTTVTVALPLTDARPAKQPPKEKKPSTLDQRLREMV